MVLPIGINVFYFLCKTDDLFPFYDRWLPHMSGRWVTDCIANMEEVDTQLAVI